MDKGSTPTDKANALTDLGKPFNVKAKDLTDKAKENQRSNG